MSSDATTSATRRRADAQRNIEAILDAAVGLLVEQPDASMSEIADRAGVARQTVYAHYPSRKALLQAVVDRAFTRSSAAMDTALLDDGTAREALERLMQANWETVESHARILEAIRTEVSAGELDRRHHDVVGRLLRLIRRGQRAGEFDRDVPAAWLVAVTIGTIHAAALEVAAGRMSSKRAGEAARRTVLRALAAG